MYGKNAHPIELMIFEKKLHGKFFAALLEFRIFDSIRIPFRIFACEHLFQMDRNRK